MFDIIVLRHGITKQSILHVQLWLAVTHLPHNAMRKAEFAVCTCTQTQIIAKLPIVEVVPAAMAGFGIGGNFVAV